MSHPPETPRQPSPAERAMAANAGSRDRQGKRQDRVTRERRAAHDLYAGANLDQIGDPSARVSLEGGQAALTAPSPNPTDRNARRAAENEGMAGHRDRRGVADDMPDR